MNFRLSKIFEE